MEKDYHFLLVTSLLTSYIIIDSRSFLTALSGMQSSNYVIYLLFTLKNENNARTFVF